MTELITIDGAFGEGGGQIVRSSLTLSLVTGKPFCIHSIRAGRQRPGLMRQHLTAIQAAAEIGHAEVVGAAIGSRHFTFRPTQIESGDYRFSVGTAGSTTLVLQTILPALLVARGESRLTLEGGTHNPFAPPFDFFDKSYLPQICRMGPRIEAKLACPGFYPAGGGCLTVHVSPTDDLGALEIIERSPITERHVRILIANLPRHIAEREEKTIAARADWNDSVVSIEECTRSPGPGNVVMIELQSETITEVVTSFGKVGLKAERVASNAVRAAQTYVNADVPVGEYLADQLMLPMGIGAAQGTGGGAFRTGVLSLHAETHLAVLRMFLDIRCTSEGDSNGHRIVRIAPS
jgi:RNA 3'-terminal phosphate cyclase (ATP)